MNRLSIGKLRGTQQMADTYVSSWYSKMDSKNGRFVQVAEGWYQSY
jgi:hypothetical protein